MAEYFGDIERPEDLLPRERNPRTGRRVPKSRSKGQDRGMSVPRRRPPGWAAAGGTAAVVAIALAVVVAKNSDDDTQRVSGPPESIVPSSVAPAVTAPLLLPASSAVPASTEAASTSTGAPTTVAATTTIEPTTTIAATTTVATTVAEVPIRLQMAPTEATVQVIPADPGGTSTVQGPPLVLSYVVDCVATGCTFPLSVNAPGTVTAEGFNFIVAADNRFTSTTTTLETCTGSQGTTFSREITKTLDLLLSGAQIVNGISVPQRLSGALTVLTPEAGFVPHVGDAFPNGQETGCPGQTLIITVDAPLGVVAG